MKTNLLIKGICLLALLCSISGCKEEYNKVIEKTIYANKSSVKLFCGDKEQVTVSPGGEGYSWTSENTEVVTVTSDGLIEAFSVGITDVIVSKDGINKYIPVTVSIPTFDRVIGRPGYKRAIFGLTISNDKIKTVRVIRIDTDESQETDVNFQSGTVNASYNNLDEGQYRFRVICIDGYGNESAPFELPVQVYGDTYVNNLEMRSIMSEIVDGEGIWTIKWGSANVREGAIGTEIEYQKGDGTKKTVTISVSESVTIISDATPGSEYKYRTLYLVGEEPVSTNYVTRIISTKFLEVFIPVDRFRNAALPGDYYTAYNGSFPLEKAWDRSGGLYATELLSPPLAPQHFTIEVGRTVIINRFKMYPRGGNSELYRDAGPRLVEVWGSMYPPSDGSWNNWYKLGAWEQLKPSGYGVGADVGPITDEDVAWFNSGGNYVVEATAEIPNPFIPIKYIRFKVVHTFASYSGAASGNLCIGELEFYGGILEE
jgi:hypothetical protein